MLDSFDSHIQGIPCQILVIEYEPEIPMRVYGPGMADADPPEEGVFQFEVLDRKGYPAPWLAKKLTSNDENRIQSEYENQFVMN